MNTTPAIALLALLLILLTAPSPAAEPLPPATNGAAPDRLSSETARNPRSPDPRSATTSSLSISHIAHLLTENPGPTPASDPRSATTQTAATTGTAASGRPTTATIAALTTPTTASAPATPTLSGAPPPSAIVNGIVALNDATEKELMDGLSLDNGRAHGIIVYRRIFGPFKAVTDLRNIPGFSDSLIETLRDKIHVAPPRASPPRKPGATRSGAVRRP